MFEGQETVKIAAIGAASEIVRDVLGKGEIRHTELAGFTHDICLALMNGANATDKGVKKADGRRNESSS